MSLCDCKCDEKGLTLDDCEKGINIDKIKKSGDVVSNSEQCDILPNTEKGLFHIYCLNKKLINTTCEILNRLKCIQKKVKSICRTQLCMRERMDEINTLTLKRNKAQVKRLRGIDLTNTNDLEAVYALAKKIYDEEEARLNRNKKRLEEIKANPTTEVKDDIYLSGNYYEGGRGSYDYYKGFSIATSKPNVEYVRGGLGFGDNPQKTAYDAELSSGFSVMLHNVATTTKGKQVNCKVIIKKAFTRRDSETFYATGKSDRHVKVYNSSGGIAFGLYKVYRINGTFEFTDESGKPLNLMLVGVVNDIDYQQGFSLKFNNSQLIYKIPPGAGVTERANQFFNSTELVGAQNEESIPFGSMLFAGVGSSIDFSVISRFEETAEHFDDGDLEVADWVMEFFGNTFRGELLDLSIPEKPLKPLKKCGTLDCDFDCFKEN